MPTLSERSHAEYLCNVLNQYVTITETDSAAEACLYINGELNKSEMSDFLMEMFEFANRIAPKGTAVWVSDDKFELREDKQ